MESVSVDGRQGKNKNILKNNLKYHKRAIIDSGFFFFSFLILSTEETILLLDVSA